MDHRSFSNSAKLHTTDSMRGNRYLQKISMQATVYVGCWDMKRYLEHKTYFDLHSWAAIFTERYQKRKSEV